MSTYPSVIGSLTNPLPSNTLNNPSHSGLHQSENGEIIAIETFVGTTSSAVGTLIYDIRAAASGGGGHIQTATLGGTGQTTYIKGNLLVAQSSNVLTKLAVGTDGQALIADSSQATGMKWGTPGTVPSVIVVAASSVYTANPARTFAVVEIVGGGGGATGTAGAGAGGYGRSVLPISSITSSVLVTIGAAGTGNSNGGATLFGAFMTASGGVGTNNTVAGAGGSVLGAQVRVFGGTGMPGSAGITGIGGAGYYGGPPAFGAGATSGNSPASGGGYVVITEY